MKRIAILAGMLLVADQAHAIEHVVAKVSVVESSYMPGTVTFILADGTAQCPTGKWLVWQRDPENNKATYAMLMTAIVSGKKVKVYFDNGDSTCVPRHLHLVD